MSNGYWSLDSETFNKIIKHICHISSVQMERHTQVVLVIQWRRNRTVKSGWEHERLLLAANSWKQSIETWIRIGLFFISKLLPPYRSRSVSPWRSQINPPQLLSSPLLHRTVEARKLIFFYFHLLLSYVYIFLQLPLYIHLLFSFNFLQITCSS